MLASCVSGYMTQWLRSACWSGHTLTLSHGDSQYCINAQLASVSNHGIRRALVLHQSWGEKWPCSVHTRVRRNNALNVSPLSGQHHHPSSPSNWQRGFGWPLALKIWIVVTCYCVHAITCAYRGETYCIYTVPVIVVLCALIKIPLCIVLGKFFFFNVWSDLWDQIIRLGVWFRSRPHFELGCGIPRQCLRQKGGTQNTNTLLIFAYYQKLKNPCNELTDSERTYLYNSCYNYSFKSYE